MNIKQTIRNLVLGGLLLIPVALVAITPSATSYAQQKCGGVDTAIISCTDQKGGGELTDSGLWGILLIVVNIMTVGVGVLALAGIVYGSVLYTSAGGSPEQVKKAYTIFTNVVIGVVAFGGMYALLNFLIPGGVFN